MADYQLTTPVPAVQYIEDGQGSVIEFVNAQEIDDKSKLAYSNESGNFYGITTEDIEVSDWIVNELGVFARYTNAAFVAKYTIVA